MNAAARTGPVDPRADEPGGDPTALGGYTFDLLPEEIGHGGWVAIVEGDAEECTVDDDSAEWCDVPCD